VQQHVREKEEAHFFAIAQFYIWMALQDLVEPGRAAAEGTDSYKGWWTPLYKSVFLKQIFLPFSKYLSNGLRDNTAPAVRKSHGSFASSPESRPTLTSSSITAKTMPNDRANEVMASPKILTITLLAS